MFDKLDTYKKEQERKPDDWWHEAWLKNFEGTGNVGTACRAVGISRQTAYTHKKQFPEFSCRWNEIVQGHVDDLEQCAADRAFNGSDTLLIFLLKSRRPETYRENIRHEVGFSKMNDDQLREFIQNRIRGIGGGNS
jgi:hypothetical protein